MVNFHLGACSAAHLIAAGLCCMLCGEKALSNYHVTVLCVLTGYPLAVIHRWFLYGTSANKQHLYFILSGLVIGYFNFGK